MVLCVASIDYASHTNLKDTTVAEDTNMKIVKGCSLLLTDGWYSIRCVIDTPLVALIHEGRIRVGDKLCLFGAQLVGNPEPAPPLQAPPDVMLKISANGTRRARWNTKLGYLRNPQPPALPICSLFPTGGMVACVDVIVTRIYPLQYMEKMIDGSSIWRCERAEQRAARKYEQDRNNHMEKLFSKLQAEFEKDFNNISTSELKKSPRKKWTQKEIQSLHTGCEIYEALMCCTDPASFEVCLSRGQVDLLSEYKRKMQEERQQELQAELRKQMSEASESPARNVVPLVKIRIAGCSTKDLDSKTSTVLTMWRPQSGVMETLKEGKRYKIYNLMASENRGRQAPCKTSLTITRSTRYQEIEVDDNFLDLLYEPREVMNLRELKPSFLPFASEVDIVGIVVYVSKLGTFDRQSGSGGSVQSVYFADMDGDICSVKFWGGLATYGVDDLLLAKSIVACSNLQWKPDNGNHVPTLTATDTSMFAVNPREPYLSAAMKKVKSFMKHDAEQFLVCAEEKVQRVLGSRASVINIQVRNQGHYSPQPNIKVTSEIVSKSLAPRRPSSVYTCGAKRTPVKDILVTQQSNPPSGSRKTDIAGESRLKSQGKIETVTSDDKREDSGQILVKNKEPENEDSKEIKLAIAESGGKTRCESPANIVSNNILGDPKLASRKVLQKIKSRQLLDYGIAPNQSPLNSPIPVTVRKAFKPPSRKSPFTPLHNVHRQQDQAIPKSPTEEDTDSVRINLENKLTNMDNKKTKSCDSDLDIQDEWDKETNEASKHGLIHACQNSDAHAISDGSQSSTQGVAKQKNRKQLRKTPKRNRSDSEDSSSSPLPNKRRASLRLRNK